MPNMRGVVAEQEVALGLQMLTEDRPLWHCKFPDKRAYTGGWDKYKVTCPKCQHRFEWTSPFIPPAAPADFVVVTPHVAALLEIKSGRLANFPIRHISEKPHQIAASREIAQVSPIGRGFYIIIKRYQLPIRGWALTGDQISKLVAEAETQSRWSCPWGDIESLGKELRRFTVKSGVSYFDLGELLK